jgi:hypothetical protein
VAATSLAALPRRERTTAAGRLRGVGPVLHPLLCALVTAASCVAHVWLAASGGHSVWLTLVMLALAAVCVPCSVHIWRHSRVGALHQVTLSALAMVALHAVLLLGAGGAAHSHGGGPSSYVPDLSGAAQLLLVIGLELATALLAATLVARLRAPRNN